MKDLILPGVGKVTTVDEALVTDDDLGNNFFLMLEDRGKAR